MKSHSYIRFGTAPFLYLLLAYLLGICIGFQINPDSHVYLYVKIISILCIILFLSIATCRFNDYRSYKYLSVIFYLFLIFIGWNLTWKPHPAFNQAHFSHVRPQALIGYLDDEPKITKTTARFPFKVTHTIQDGVESVGEGNLLVIIRLDSLSEPNISNLQYGYEFLLPSSFSLINLPYNPNEFDYRSYMENRSIWHQVNLSIEDIQYLGSKRGNPLIAKAFTVRQKMLKKLNQSFVNSDAFSIASALLLGYRNELDQEVINTFSATGTIHVLAVSGLHVGIIFLVFSLFLFWMKGGLWQIVKSLLLIILIWIYAFITGLSPPVLRASIMISFGIIAFTLARKGNAYNTIAASAFFLLVYNPNFLAEIGFQLSYLAVLGIVYLYPKINGIVTTKNKVFSGLWSYTSISISAQIATLPLVIYYFHSFPVYFLPANIFIVLPVTFVLYLGVVVLIIPYGAVHSGVSYILENLIILMNKVLLLFEQLPYSVLNGIWISPWQSILLYMLLIAGIIHVFSKEKNAKYIVIACMLLLLSSRANKVRSRSKNEIRIFNVYKNMAIGLFDQDGVVLLTDSLNEENSRFVYSVKPNIEASGRLNQMQIIRDTETFDRDNFLIINNIIQFHDKSLLIYSEEHSFTDSIHIDLLYIRNNTQIKLQQIINNIHFKKIILDATNADWYIEQIERDAELIDIPVYILKNNFAYVW